MTVADDDPEGPDGLDALPGLARIAASAAWRTSGWALGTYLHTARRVAEAAISPRQAVRLARDVQHGTEDLVRGLINSTDVGQRVNSGPAGDVARRAVHDVAAVVGTQRPPRRDDHDPGNGHVSDRTLRDEGEALLRKSRDVRFEIEAHPAYERILSELAPDEGRILRLLLLDGPQAAVDVRTGGPLGMLRSRLIAPGISMIGARAGVRYVDRVPSYLNNLFRLGLIWFSRETLRDHMKYQVLEAQPEVLDAIHSVSQAKVVRRSIHLTPFGEDFCRVCLMPEQVAAGELPAHSDPPDDHKTASPPIEPGESASADSPVP
ncbi:MAG TPA: Abi-alpha family protein [Solirubrobacteraceae bacterium]|nr:Abi-alpha family protein [Solirubrobacteraceae bacterium]